MAEAVGRKPGEGHDHSWAADVGEATALCPDLNPRLKGTGIRCPGDPATVRSPDAPVPVGTAPWSHTIKGYFGEELTIAAYPPCEGEGGAITIAIREDKTGASILVESREARDDLARAWMEAERVASGEPPALEAGPIACGECDDGLIAVGRCNCGSPADQSVSYMHERLCGYEPCPSGCWDILHPSAPSAGRPMTDGEYAELQYENTAAADLKGDR